MYKLLSPHAASVLPFYNNKWWVKAYGKGLFGRVFWFYLVRGTSSRWSNVTDEDLLRTEGVKVTKASVLLLGEQVKSEPGVLVLMLDWLEWQARQEQGLPPGPRPCGGGPGYREGCLKAHSSSGLW